MLDVPHAPTQSHQVLCFVLAHLQHTHVRLLVRTAARANSHAALPPVLQALLGQMYAEGYGTNKDTKLAKEWGDRAASRGYRMQGVYCEL